MAGAYYTPKPMLRGAPWSQRLRATWAEYRSLDRRVHYLAIARSINTVGFSIVLPFMAVYLHKTRGVSGFGYGAIYFVGGVCSALAQGIAGELADRYGRRRVMVTGLSLRAVNLAALGFAIEQHATIATIAGLVISNATLRGLFEPAASAAVADLTEPSKRIAAYGVQKIGVNIGWSVGPALGGYLSSASYGALFYFSAPVTLFAAWICWRIKDSDVARAAIARGDTPASAIEAAGAAGPRMAPAFFMLIGIAFLMAVANTQIFSTLSVYSEELLGLDRVEVGLLYTINGIIVVGLQVPAVALIARIGTGPALVIGPLTYMVGYLAMGFATGFATLAPIMAFMTLGEIMLSPAQTSTAAAVGDPRRLGRSMGLFGLMQQLGVSVGPLVGGLAIDHLGHNHVLMWASLAVLPCAVAIAYSVFSRRHLRLA